MNLDIIRIAIKSHHTKVCFIYQIKLEKVIKCFLRFWSNLLIKNDLLLHFLFMLRKQSSIPLFISFFIKIDLLILYKLKLTNNRIFININSMQKIASQPQGLRRVCSSELMVISEDKEFRKPQLADKFSPRNSQFILSPKSKLVQKENFNLNKMTS